MGLHKKFEAKGLVVIAMFRGEGSTGEISRLARLKKWTFSVYNTGTVENYTLQANPQVFLFDASGALVFKPTEGSKVERKATEAATAAPDWILGAFDYKIFVGETKSVAARKNLGATAAMLEDKLKDAQDGDEKTEATHLLGRLKWYAGRCEARWKRLLDDGRPTEALAALKQLGAEFKGHALGDQAAEAEKGLMSDPSFKSELGAEKQAKAIEDAFFKVKPRREGEDEKKWESKYGRAVKDIQTKLAALEKKFGETKVFARVRALVAEIG